MALARRKIDVQFKLASGTFTGQSGNTATLSGLRISVKCTKAGGPSMGQAQIRIYGMSLSLMNQLSTLGLIFLLVPRNEVTILAGDDDNGMSTVFIGTITAAWADFQGAPDVAFNIEAHTGISGAVDTLEPSSYTGSTDVAVIMSSLATKMSLSFENSGVQVKLANPYFYGSPRNQAYACAEAAGISIAIDDRTLAIWPLGKSRSGAVPEISKDTGMVSYPTYTAQGIMVRTLYNPSISFGSKIKLVSALDPANGEWVVYSLEHDLESNLPNGQWFSMIGAYNPKYPAPVIL